MNDKSKLELIGEIAQANNKNLELIQEINQLQSNWDSLREWLEKQISNDLDGIFSYSGRQCKETLDKMNELEGEDKEELNYEVEILDNEDEDIEEMTMCTSGIMGFDAVEHITTELKDKLNNLVREVNKLKKIDYLKSKGE